MNSLDSEQWTLYSVMSLPIFICTSSDSHVIVVRVQILIVL